jgi:hypothetical protein
MLRVNSLILRSRARVLALAFLRCYFRTASFTWIAAVAWGLRLRSSKAVARERGNGRGEDRAHREIPLPQSRDRNDDRRQGLNQADKLKLVPT